MFSKCGPILRVPTVLVSVVIGLTGLENKKRTLVVIILLSSIEAPQKKFETSSLFTPSEVCSSSRVTEGDLAIQEPHLRVQHTVNLIEISILIYLSENIQFDFS
jgi:hypothetical protein